MRYYESEAVTFRLAETKDAEPIALLHATSWRQNYRGMMPDEFLDGDVLANRTAVWRDRLGGARDNQFVYVAEQNSKLIGFVCAFGDKDPTWGSYIDNLHVAREFKGMGIGTALMKHVALWLQSSYPQAGVYLWVIEANVGARRFYEALGSINAGIQDQPDPGGGSAPCCRYVWTNAKALLNTCGSP